MALRKSRSDKVLAGVCGGLAEQWGVDSTLVRVLFVVGTLFTGFVPGLLAYLVFVLVMDLCERVSLFLGMRVWVRGCRVGRRLVMIRW